MATILQTQEIQVTPKPPDFSSGIMTLFGILIASIISMLSGLRVGKMQALAVQRAAEANAKAITESAERTAQNLFQQNIIDDLTDLRSVASRNQAEQDILRERVNTLSIELHAANIREMDYKTQIEKQSRQIESLSMQLEESMRLKAKMQAEIDELRRQLIAHEPISEKK